jgi:hypothetical protein
MATWLLAAEGDPCIPARVLHRKRHFLSVNDLSKADSRN